jgi:glycosyltransferase involved in cell wall biosynthesis
MSVRPSPVISVVIPAFRRTDALRKAMRSVFAQDLSPHTYELLVIDSSPEPDNMRMLEELRAEATCELRVLRKQPEGPGPSRNLGARNAHGSFIAFLDSDCHAAPGWLRASLAAFTPEVGLVQGQTAPDPAGRPGVFTHTVVVDCENHVYETCNVTYRRTAFAQAGGFPADLHPLANEPMGGEDVELAWTVKRAGWESRYADEALVYHEVVPIGLSRWIYGKRLFIWPRVARRVPEVRRFFVAKVFYDRPQALLCAALAGMAGSILSPWLLSLCVPYIWTRASEQTSTLSGARRIVRVAAYGIKDTVSLTVLLAGSIRFRSLVL